MIGETDGARLSMTRPDIAVSLPEGYSLSRIRPNTP